MERNASAHWTGSLKEGRGRFSTATGGVKDLPYTFSTRFGDERGTNPEELIAAAHASCFSMALSGELGKAGLTATAIDTTATVTMEKVDDKMTVTKSHLSLVATVPGADEARFLAAAEAAKAGCPISRLLSPGLKISLDAKLG